MTEENSITIKKSSVWMFATFVLLAIVIVGGIFLIKGKTVTNNVVADNQEAVNLNVFLSDDSVYPSLGPKNADTVVVEFSDFQCPYCALASGLPAFAQDYATQYGDLIGVAQDIQDKAANDEIRFVYVPMSFLGQESVFAAQAGLCANKQGKFWEMHDAIFSAHDSKENNGKFSKANLKIIAAKISGLNTAEFNSCLDNDDTLADVQKAATESSKAASGTPTFYVNGQKVPASKNAISQYL